MRHVPGWTAGLLAALMLGASWLYCYQTSRGSEAVAAFSHAVEYGAWQAAGESGADARPTEQSIFWVETATPTPTEIEAHDVLTDTPYAQPAPSPAPSASPDASGFALEVVAVASEEPVKRVLIYHTHTYEAYEQAADDPYRETEKWRTADSEHNVVRVGAELAALLRGLGYTVTHDATAFEPPSLSSAYGRSLVMLERRIAAGERYDLYIDLHRDAYVASQAGANTVNLGGAEAAKLMLLIGKGEGQTTQGFDARPDWEQNLALAQAVTDALSKQADGLCKDVRIKAGRFNQHVDDCCVLVEVGNNRNTLKEALAAMPYLADAIAEALESQAPSTAQ